MVTVNDIRARFLEYFAEAGHRVVPSSPLVPHNDPTLLFTNAGMVQFKNVFTGLEKRDYATAVTSQKCVRAGGKHNDLDNVGYTARHHTFFEMLGNFSFGDYFKERAIELAWNLVTRDFALPKDKLCVTVYHTDDEAFNLWKRIAGLPDEKIIRIPTSDNFWAMGDSGPCGPCSEIFYDHGPEIPGGPPGSAEQDGDRFIEIWNLVFMQYDQQPGGERTPLPKPSIDTGMGLERLAAVLQGVHDNYDTDLFRTLIRASVEASGRGEEGEARISHRVIADHLRSSCFLIADGVLPSNEGRGYVLRRIMRRAMRHAHQLGCREALMHKLVPALVGLMGQAYPELSRAQALMTDTLRIEEERFKQTLERGLKLLEEEAATVSGGAFPGEAAFRLYDTYGFPIDLTADVLRTKGMTVDMPAFDAAMQRQKEEARKHWAGSGEKSDGRLWFELRERHGATEFLGYTRESSEGIVQAIVKDGAVVERAEAGDTIQFIANQTPFYAESGGQIGDTGAARNGVKASLRITDTQKAAGDLHVHTAVVESGALAVGDSLELEVDHDRRAAIRGAHSATHLIHNALRRLLGHHVAQKGSLVLPGKFRFDFSHPKGLTREEIVFIEDEVNRLIRQNSEVRTQLLPQEDAVRAGAIAMFGEKYGDEVRVISMGMDGFDYYSVELCGGTHVYETGDIGMFKIVGESSVAAGVRRIEALTGQEALLYVRTLEDSVAVASDALKVSAAELPTRINALLDEKRKLEKELADLRKAAALGGGAAPKAEVEEIGGIRFIARTLADVPAKDLKGVADELKKQVGSGVVAVLSAHEGKAGAVVAVTPDRTGVVNAVDLARLAASALGGSGGGGRPDMAQSGGPDTGRLQEAVDAIRSQLQQLKSVA